MKSYRQKRQLHKLTKAVNSLYQPPKKYPNCNFSQPFHKKYRVTSLLISNMKSSKSKLIICFRVRTVCWLILQLKVPLTPKIFLSRQKGPFCSDHIGEKIIFVRFFLDFLWIFKIRKIRATVVHGRVTWRMGRVGLWRQPGKPFRLERWCESEDTADQRSQRDCSEEKNYYSAL